MEGSRKCSTRLTCPEITPPKAIPTNRELITSFVQNASTIATKGGKTDQNPKCPWYSGKRPWKIIPKIIRIKTMARLILLPFDTREIKLFRLSDIGCTWLVY